MAKKLKPMVRMSKEQIEQKQLFVERYMGSSNAASGSAVDANSNVAFKTVSTLGAEIFKDFYIQVNRQAMFDRITSLFGAEQAQKYLDMLESHIIYKNDETSVASGMPYCVSITMYPFLEHGMTKIGGESKAPKHLESFCGSFINLVFAVSSQFAGAVATPELLNYFHYFAKKDYGDDYLNTHTDVIKSKLQHIVYSLNQPAASRGYQSVFHNMSVYDRYFYESVFGDFVFPDMSKVTYDDIAPLQRFFLEWLLNERKKSLLTFPVLTEASLNEGDKPKDEDFADMIADLRSRGLSMFSYNDDNAAAISSCCRLKSEFDKDEFSFSMGTPSVATGSTSVITINMHRVVYERVDLEALIDDIHKFQAAHRSLVQDCINAGLLPVYDAGYISLDKQFCTIGLNGLNEAAEYLGYIVNNNEEYKQWLVDLVSLFTKKNKEAKRRYGIKFNTECVPAESLGVKNAKWDKDAGLNVERICYNSYFYLPEDPNTSIVDKFQLHGGEIAANMDGGQALHLNIAKLPDKEFFLWLRHLAAKYKTTYWTTNVMTSCCNECGTNDMDTVEQCKHCGSTNISYATRVIGYLRKLDSYAEGRKAEAVTRFYH